MSLGITKSTLGIMGVNVQIHFDQETMFRLERSISILSLLKNKNKFHAFLCIDDLSQKNKKNKKKHPIDMINCFY